MKISFTISLVLFLTLHCYSTSWKAAFPYKQTMKGQKIVIKATPYSPYSPSPIIGETKVYNGNKFLYKIDKYFRDIILVSNDGKYLLVIKSSLIQPINNNTVAIEIFEQGLPIKEISIGELIELNNFKNEDSIFQWVNLYSITNKNVIIQTSNQNIIEIKFNNFEINKGLIINSKIKPTYIKRKYKKTKLPDENYFPNSIQNGSIEELVVEQFGYSISNSLNKLYSIYVVLLIDQKGNPEVIHISVSHHKNPKDSFDYGTNDDNMSNTLKNWLEQQKFETDKIPKGFKKYCFKSSVYLL